MIPTAPSQTAERLVRAITQSILDCDDVTEVEAADVGAARRLALIDFADRHNLDLEDTSTLFRIAAGGTP
jgi:hypothetical protein